MNRSNRQKLNREIRELAEVINQMDLTDIYRRFHPNKKNIPTSEHLRESSLKLITYMVTKKTSTNTKKKCGNPLCLIRSPWSKVSYHS